MNRPIYFTIFLIGVLCPLVFGVAGVTSHNFSMRAQGSLISTIIPPLCGFTLIVFKKDEITLSEHKPVGLFRRFFAVQCDMQLFIMTTVPPIALLFLGIEYLHTGTLAWSFERDYARLTDLLLLPLGIAIIVGLY